MENLLVGSDTPIIDKDHAFYEGISEVVDAIVESGTILDADTHAHDISEFAFELAESTVSSQISRYSFAIYLIDDIEHKTVDSSVITSSGPFESPSAKYNFMVIPIDSSSSESPEFLVMIQQMISNAFSFFLVVRSLCLSSIYFHVWG